MSRKVFPDARMRQNPAKPNQTAPESDMWLTSFPVVLPLFTDDRLWGALTVHENLDLAAQLYTPNDTAEQRMSRIERVVDRMGLKSCQHTKVGSALIKGISGGQRRRVSIAVELMGSPSLLFLDEPTSGLDSKSAAEIMKVGPAKSSTCPCDM
jgi:ABC-type multidrug transport system ATPase subunit